MVVAVAKRKKAEDAEDAESTIQALQHKVANPYDKVTGSAGIPPPQWPLYNGLQCCGKHDPSRVVVHVHRSSDSRSATQRASTGRSAR